MFQRHDNVLIGSILEIIRDNPRIVLLDIIIVRTALLESTEIPGNHVFARRSDDGLLSLVDSGVEPGGSEIDGRVHVCDMFWFELESAWDRFGVGRETSIES